MRQSGTGRTHKIERTPWLAVMPFDFVDCRPEAASFDAALGATRPRLRAVGLLLVLMRRTCLPDARLEIPSPEVKLIEVQHECRT